MVLTAYIPEVKPYARHSPACKFQEGEHPDCKCKKYVYQAQTPTSKAQRISTYSRSWKVAREKAEEIRDSFDPKLRELQLLKQKAHADAERKQILLTDALAEWIADKEKLGVTEGTLDIYYWVQKHLPIFAAERGLNFLHEVADTAFLTRWRNSWSDKKTLSIRTKQGRVTAFFAFCVRMKWLDENPAGGRSNPDGGLTKITVDDWVPMAPFTREQYEAILEACLLHPKAENCRKNPVDTPRILWTLAQLLRWSGLAPIDALMLRRDQLDDNGVIETTRRKTGKDLAVQLPEAVAEAVRNVPPCKNRHPEYFFWNGSATARDLQTMWWCRFNAIWDKVTPQLVMRGIDKQLQRPHPYMFRATFAVEYLQTEQGDIYKLAKLLGNTVKMCEKHYLPYVPKLKQIVLDNHRASLEEQGAPRMAPAQVLRFRRSAGARKSGS